MVRYLSGPGYVAPLAGRRVAQTGEYGSAKAQVTASNCGNSLGRAAGRTAGRGVAHDRGQLHPVSRLIPDGSSMNAPTRGLKEPEMSRLKSFFTEDSHGEWVDRVTEEQPTTSVGLYSRVWEGK